MSIVVTGASSGLGRQLAVEFARNTKCDVIISGRDTVRLEKTAEIIRRSGSIPRMEAGDIRLQETQNRIRQRYYGRLTTLVLCAGVHTSAPDRQIIETNLIVPISMINTALVNGGPLHQIVYINSTAGTQFTGHQESAYSASKHGMTAYMRAMAGEWARAGVRSLNVFPGAMRTPMTSDRPDHEYLIRPAHVAAAIYDVVRSTTMSAQTTELHLGRFCFPDTGVSGE
jgi:NAD(P)-dependent dehydrogenase (short-subunit alcohol dehydrogenase family)